MATYEGAEVETDINVLDRDICLRTSICGHDVPAEDIIIEEDPAEDAPVLPRTSCRCADMRT